jgi:transcriptional regulator with GAF, ATPase, and Fis domain
VRASSFQLNATHPPSRRVVLQAANWKIKGPDGAAELMGVKPTTLLARMKKWGLKKPAE